MPELQHIRPASIGPTNIGASQITRALARSSLVGDAELTELRAAVSEYVQVQRATGLAPEATIVHIKRLVTQALPADAPVEMRQPLIARLIDWVLTAYYGETRADRPARE